MGNERKDSFSTLDSLPDKSGIDLRRLEEDLGAYSGESVHVFRGKASTCSEDNRPGVPEKTVQSHRSVATLGFPIFQSSYSLSSLNVVFSWILPLG